MKFIKKQENEEKVVEWRMHVEESVVKLYATYNGMEFCVCSIYDNGLYRHTSVKTIFGDACDSEGRINDISRDE